MNYLQDSTMLASKKIALFDILADCGKNLKLEINLQYKNSNQTIKVKKKNEYSWSANCNVLIFIQ